MLTKFTPSGMPAPKTHHQGALAVEAKKMLFIAGQVGIRPDGSIPESVGDQALAAIANLNRVLEEAGMTRDDLARITIYLTEGSDIPDFVGAAGHTLGASPPPATLLIVKALADPSLKVEIEGIAVQ